MCLNPVRVKRYNPVTRVTWYDTVPCGKCIECLRRKQSDYAFLSSRQAKESGNIFFLTLTYRNSAIPFAGVYEVFDLETGLIVDRSKPYFVEEEYISTVREDYYSACPESGWQMEVPNHYIKPYERKEYVKEWLYTPGRYTTFRIDDACVYRDGYDKGGTRLGVRCVVTPSLRRQHVKDWLKSSREAFFRQYGYRMNFKYFEVGEYGPNTHRPHVHCLFYGITSVEAEFLANRWRESFGRVDIEEVRARGSDSLEVAQEKVSRYLAKYLCKGEFEESFVSDGFVERPRRVSSRRLGTENLDDLRAYILGFDRFGEYDPDCPPKEVLTDESLDFLLTRRYLTRFKPDATPVLVRIPKLVYNRCLSKLYGKSKDDRKRLGFCRSQDTTFTFRASHERSLLSHKLAARAKYLADTRSLQQLSAAESLFRAGSPFVDFDHLVKAIQARSQNVRRSSAKVYRKELRAFYRSSLF